VLSPRKNESSWDSKWDAWTKILVSGGSIETIIEKGKLELREDLSSKTTNWMVVCLPCDKHANCECKPHAGRAYHDPIAFVLDEQDPAGGYTVDERGNLIICQPGNFQGHEARGKHLQTTRSIRYRASGDKKTLKYLPTICDLINQGGNSGSSVDRRGGGGGGESEGRGGDADERETDVILVMRVNEVDLSTHMMMMIAFITFKSSLVPLFEGL